MGGYVRCAICNIQFIYPCPVKWTNHGYAHAACIRKEAGWWETIKWILKGCPKW